MASRKALEPLALVRSPMARNAVSWRNGTCWYSEATPGSGRGRRGASGRPRSRPVSSAMCSGVVPQHPPTSESPNSRQNVSWAAASSSGCTG